MESDPSNVLLDLRSLRLNGRKSSPQRSFRARSDRWITMGELWVNHGLTMGEPLVSDGQ